MRLRLMHNSNGLSLNGIAVHREPSGLLDRNTAKKLVEAGLLAPHEWLHSQPARTPHVKQCEICSAYFIGPPTSKACSVDCSAIVATRREATKQQERKKLDRRLRASCAICHKPMKSIRASKLTCSPKCRQAAYRRWINQPKDNQS
jgi:hypothetical protein